MINTKLLKKATVITLFFFIWFSVSIEFNFAQENDKYTQAMERYRANDFQGAIRLLTEFIEDIKTLAEQKRKLAESLYFLGKIYFRIGDDGQVKEKLRNAFENYPAFSINEEDLDFKDKVDGIKEKIADECYQKAKDYYNENEDDKKIDEKLINAFTLWPKFEKEETDAKFKDMVDRIKKQVAESLYLEAIYFYEKGDYNIGDVNLEKVFLLYPHFSLNGNIESFAGRVNQDVEKVLYVIARYYYNKKDDENADEFLKRLFNLNPGDYQDFIKNEENAGFKERLEKIRNEISRIIIKEDTIKKKKFPTLLVVGAVVVVGVVALLLLKKKKKKEYTLTVTVGQGVQGNPSSGSTKYEEGTTVSYNYSLQSGYTQLTVTLDGNTVASSGTITMDRNHQLNAVSTQLGSINVTSTPTGANIFLDGVDTGQMTNAVIPNVIPGTHTIRLTLTGYNPAEQTVNVTAGQETLVNITLNRSYTNVITINGKLGTKASGQDENTGQDAYQFYVGENCNLTIRFNSEGHIRPEFALFPNTNTAPGNVLVSGSGRGKSITYTVTTSGKYYAVALEDETADRDEKAGTYTITITSNIQSLGDYQQIIDEGAETLEIFLTGRN